MKWTTNINAFILNRIVVHPRFNLDNFFINKSLRIFIKVFKLNIQIVEINELSRYNKNIIVTLEKEEKFTSFGPKTLDSEKCAEVLIKPLNVYQFNNVDISTKSTAIQLGNKLLIDQNNKYLNFKGGFVLNNNLNHALINKRKTVTLEEGFFLTGYGDWNWYHWLIEILPKLLYFDSIPTNTILVSDVVLAVPSMVETLEVICKKQSNKH